MEKDKTNFFHSVYMKWLDYSINPETNAVNMDIISVYCEFLKDFIEFNDIEIYCKTVGENDYTIQELKSIWKHVGNAYKINLSIVVPAKFEDEAMEKINALLKTKDIEEFKIEQCTLINNKPK
jgi:hypothetical protein